MATMSFAEARNRAIADAMNSDPRTILIGGWGGPGAPEGGFAEAFGRLRVRSIPISEEGYGGAAVGAAMAGLRPIVSFSTGSFMYNAWEPVVNEAALFRYMSGGQHAVPVVFHFYSGLRPGAAAQHSQTPHAMLCNAPGLVVVAPGTAKAAYDLMRAAIDSDDPVVYVDSLKLAREQGEVDPDHVPDEVRAEVVRPGTDVTIVAVSAMVARALHVAEKLAGEGISIEVVDPRVLSPLDRDGILASVARTGRLVAADEGQLTCGVASEIVASVAELGHDLLKSAPRRVAIPDVPAPMSPALDAAITPSEERLEAAVRATLG
jgi:acetoin:2,6-dichlorophenolindophenol oxidoreductase subunit beta